MVDFFFVLPQSIHVGWEVSECRLYGSKTIYLGSEKAWKFLQRSDEIYKLGMAVSIVPAAEEVILCHFRWQNDESYITEPMSKTPVVIMADMQRSPAARSIDLLVRGLQQQHEHHDEYFRNCLNIFQHLHKGWVLIKKVEDDVAIVIV